MNKVIFGILLITVGCNNVNTDKQEEKKNIEIDKLQPISQSPTEEIIASEKKGVEKDILYEYNDDTLSQTLKIKYISKEEIDFEIASINKIKNKKSILTGIAKGSLNQDPEMDEDDQGNGYAAREYRYSKEACSIGIRIAIDEAKNKAKVTEYNCYNLRDSNCPFESVGVLKKIEN